MEATRATSSLSSTLWLVIMHDGKVNILPPYERIYTFALVNSRKAEVAFATIMQYMKKENGFTLNASLKYI